ncbi:kelch repeat-containing protein [Spirosoma spitsbergense]|uniref:kelch repeat-containing protein n=1 Tax=Spirosoma spitsbergense TaxID=431554 RepID=UPI003CCBF995
MADLGRNIFGTSFLVFPVDDKLYVYSGLYSSSGGTPPAPSMWEYDPAKNQWTNLGNSLGENLLQSRYQLSADGKAYFYSSYPYGVLAFDARQKRVDIVSKTNLLTNMTRTMRSFKQLRPIQIHRKRADGYLCRRVLLACVRKMNRRLARHTC